MSIGARVSDPWNSVARLHAAVLGKVKNVIFTMLTGY
jgi:hypothetical protein